jgi:PEGA domain
METLMRIGLCNAVILALVWLVPSALRAESAVLRPLAPAEELSADSVRAQSVVATGLVEAHIDVLSADEVRARLARAADKPCLDIDCAGSVLDVVGADMLVAVVVGQDGGRPVDVLVGMVDMNGHRVYGSERIADGDVARAARAAFQRALGRWPARGLVAVHVDGSPAGASVLVDGQPRGVLPVELHLQPGSHTLSVTMAGYLSEQRALQLDSAHEPPELSFALARDPGAALRRRRWALGLMGGGAAGVALGALYAGYGLHALARDGECVEGAPPCERHAFGSAGRAQLGVGAALGVLGAAALSAGAVLFVRERRAARLHVVAAPGQAILTLRGSF